ncbi:hypothetical protein GF312_09205 [Candidatus Poribacteria bacterium]|nr:hypothetical protein [Candidatus Poribacteria bacterium]
MSSEHPVNIKRKSYCLSRVNRVIPPHWNVNVVHTADEVTVQDIIDAGHISEHYDEEGVVFDDVAEILAAEEAGLVTILKPGIVVNCPIISKKGAEAPGNNEAPEDFDILEPEDSF